jgi:hypothetical protein
MSTDERSVHMEKKQCYFRTNLFLHAEVLQRLSEHPPVQRHHSLFHATTHGRLPRIDHVLRSCRESFCALRATLLQVIYGSPNLYLGSFVSSLAQRESEYDPEPLRLSATWKKP